MKLQPGDRVMTSLIGNEDWYETTVLRYLAVTHGREWYKVLTRTGMTEVSRCYPEEIRTIEEHLSHMLVQ